MKLTKGAIGNLISRYRAVLKKCHLLNVFGSLALAGALAMGGAAGAQAADNKALGTGPVSYSDSTEVNNLMGGWYYNQGTFDTTVNANVPTKEEFLSGAAINLTVTGTAKISEIIGGTYLRQYYKDDSEYKDGTDYLTAKHSSITTVVGTTSEETGSTTQYVIGGSKIANVTYANIETGTISLTINSGTFGTSGSSGDYEAVIGGNYMKSDGLMYSDTRTVKDINTATATSVDTTINGGTFYATVIGGSVAHTYTNVLSREDATSLTVSDDTTSVIINDGTFVASAGGDRTKGGFYLKAAVIGGGMAYSYKTTVETGSSSVVIKGGTFGDTSGSDAKIVAGAYSANGDQVTVEKSSLSVEAGTIYDDMIGGNFVYETTSKADNSVGTSSVSMTGGTVNGEIVGGSYVRGGTGVSTVGNSTVTLDGGTQLKHSDGRAQYIIGGNKTFAYGSNSSVTTDITGTSKVVIASGTYSGGAVIGGSLTKIQASTNTLSGTSTVANSVVEMSGGTVAGIVAGGLTETHSEGAGSVITASSTVSGSSSVSVTGGTVNQLFVGASGDTLDVAIVGGGLTHVQTADNLDDGDSVSVESGSTSVSISDGTVAGTVVGGSAAINAGTASAGSTGTEISGGSVTGNVVAGGYAEGTKASTSVTETAALTVSGGTVAGMVVGGSTAVDGGTATTASTATEISGGTITGNVVAAGCAEGSGSQSSVSDTAVLTVSGGTIEGSVYTGGAAIDGGKVTTESYAVTVSGGTITEDLVVGDYFSSDDSEAEEQAMANSSDEASSGTVNISNATIGGVVTVVTDEAKVTFDGGSSTIGALYQEAGNSIVTIASGATVTTAGPITLEEGSFTVADGGTLTLTSGSESAGSISVASGATATFEDGSTLTVDAATIAAAETAVITVADGGTLTVADTSTLVLGDAVSGETYSIVSGSDASWSTIKAASDMISLVMNADGTVSAAVADATSAYSGISGETGSLLAALYAGGLNSTTADAAGVRFLSRATDSRYLGSDKGAAVKAIESTARFATLGAVPQMTKMASDAGTNAAVARFGFATSEDSVMAINAAGDEVKANDTGFALWIAPMWQNRSGFGMEAGELDYGFNGNIGGVAIGADYTFSNNIRAGLLFNMGGGYAESSGDLSGVENSMTFWGLGAYAGWTGCGFGVMADVMYTSTWNSVEGSLDSRLGMGSQLEADIQASAITAGLRAEYTFETSALDFIPHVGVRYMSLNTYGYDVESSAGTILESDGAQQSIWTFPVGITFERSFELENRWHFRPSLDFTVIPAAGDVKTREDVRYTGLAATADPETQMMDYFTWQGTAGVEFGTDSLHLGVNYTLQAGQHSTGHGVFGTLRYEF